MKNQLNPNISNLFKKSMFALHDAVSSVVVEEACRQAKVNVVECLTIPELIKDKITEINLKSLDAQADLSIAIVREAMNLHSTLKGVAEWIGVESMKGEFLIRGEDDFTSFEWTTNTAFEDVVKSIEEVSVDDWNENSSKEVFELFRRVSVAIQSVITDVMEEVNKETFSPLVEALYQSLFLARRLGYHIFITEIDTFGTAIKSTTLSTIVNGLKEEPNQ